jgi:hypothetical protein
MAIETSIWIYWLFCAIAMLLVIGKREFAYPFLSPDLSSPQKDKHYAIALILGWISTFIAATAYVLFTRKYETGNYKIPDLLVFSFSNGILEQFMFVFWLLLGCYLGKLYAPNSPKLIFTFGYISYAIFSGLIHAFFWVTVLPHHEPVSLMPVALAVMSLFWMWLFWRYQALLPIIAMHAVIDLFTIGHLNFTWFESLQSSIQSWLAL